MEHDERTSAAPGTSVTRSKNTVYTLPHDWAQLRGALAPAVERARKSVAGRTDDAAAETAGPALLVVTTDGDAAVAVARMARELLAEEDRGVLPATTAARATRLLAIDTPFGVSGAPDTLAALLRTSALKLADVRAVVVAWADELLAAGAGPDLETIFAELPKDCARVLVAGEVTEEVEALIERYMRRPRRVGEASEDAAAPLTVPVSYLTVGANGRPEALRRLLDELDPPSAVVVAPSEAGTADARLALATLGYGVGGEAVRLTTGEIPEGASLVVLYELPDAALLRAVAASGPTQVVALVQPRQLAALRRLAGGNAAAYTLSDARRRADLREERLREEIRALLADGAPSRELLALEPLLADFDGVEIAAAVLRLLDEARRSRPAAPRAAAPAAAYAAPAAEPEPSPWTRLFVNVGTRDGASAGDVLGAIAGESNISRDRIGRIEVRESHTLVDVATDVADQVVTAMTGAMMRGRRLVARVDQGRAEGGERGARPSRGERPARGERPQRGERFDRGDRGDRGGRFDRGDRGDRFERGERGPRAPYGERGARGDRFERGDRGDRGPRQERGGRPERGERFDRGPRGGGGGERGGRPGGRPPFRSTGEERRASYGRTLSDEQREWTQRGERIRHSRRTRDDDRA